MSDIIAADQLRQFIERIERLEEEKKGMSEDVRDVYGEAKSQGYPPLTSGGVSLWTAPAGAPAAARYFRIQGVYDPTINGTIQFSRVVIGKRIQLARNYSNGAQLGVKDLGSLDFSARGALIRRRGAKLRTAGLTFSAIYKDEVEGLTKPLLEQIGNTEMIALCTDPAAGAQLQSRCYFGALVGDLTHTRRNAAFWETKVNLVSTF